MFKNIFVLTCYSLVVFLLSLFFIPAQAISQECETDYNKPTIAAGLYHTVGLKEDGTVVATGGYDLSSWTNIKAIAAGETHIVGLKEDGTVVATGGYDLSSWTNIKAIAAGAYHTVGLKEDGTVVAVGNNEYWSNSNGQTEVSSWTGIRAIAAGLWLTAGLKKDGTVVATGGYDLSSWTNIKAIAAGDGHIVGLKDDGTVVAGGGSNYEFCTNGHVFEVSSWTNIKAISAGGHSTYGLKEDGTVVTAVGYNPYLSQADVSSWTNITAIAAGYYHFVGLRENGTVVAVGDDGYGQCNVWSWTNIRQPSCLEPLTTMDYLNETAADINGATFTGPGNQQNALLDKINIAISAINSSPPDTELAIWTLNDFYKILCNMKRQGKIDENTYNTLYNDYVNIMKSFGETPKTGC